MHNAITPAAMPSAMQEKLRSIRHRKIRVAVVRAIAVSASVLLIAMVLAMTIDWVATLHSVGLRVFFTLTALGAAAFALLLTLIPPLREASRWTSLAAHTDGEVPQLEERWTTIASFATSDRQPTTATERAMLEQVASEADAIGRIVEPQRVARPTELKPALVALGAAGLLMAAFLALNLPQTSVLLRRFWAPTAAITATQLFSETGDVEIPRGETIDLVTTLTGLNRDQAILQVESGSEISDTFALTPDENRPDAFIHTMVVDGSFRYRIVAGDGRTSWHTVTAIDYPMLDEVDLTITAPSYVDRPRYEKQLIPHRVKVVQGSWLNLRLKPDAPLEQMALELTLPPNGKAEAPQTQTLELAADEEGWYTFRTQLIENLSFRPILRNAHGLTNQDRHQCRIEVIADRAPVARILSPTDEMAVAIDDVIDIRFEAHDDYGVEKAELIVYDESMTENGGEPRILHVEPIELGDQQNARHIMGETQLDLKKLGLEEGTQISYAIRVADNRDVDLDPTTLASRMGQQSRAKDADRSEDGQATQREENGTPTDGADNYRAIDSESSEADKFEQMLADAGDRRASSPPQEGGSQSSSDRSERTGTDARTPSDTDANEKNGTAKPGEATQKDTVASTESNANNETAATSDNATSPDRAGTPDASEEMSDSQTPRMAASDPAERGTPSSDEPAAARRGPANDSMDDSPTPSGDDRPGAVASADETGTRGTDPPGNNQRSDAATARSESDDANRDGMKPSNDGKTQPGETPPDSIAATDAEMSAGEQNRTDSDATKSQPPAAMAANDRPQATGDPDNAGSDPSDSDDATPPENPSDAGTSPQSVAAAEPETDSDSPAGDSPAGRMQDDDASEESGTVESDTIAAMDARDGKPSDANATERPTERSASPRPGEPQTTSEEADSPNTDQTDTQLTDRPNRPSQGGSPQVSPSGNRREQTPPSNVAVEMPPLRVQPNLDAQTSESSQDTESVRRKLKITARLSAVAAATAREKEKTDIRSRVVHIDELLAITEQGLRRLVDRTIPDAERSDQFRLLDQQLGDVEETIAQLREETREHRFVFVGLQMAEIGRLHVTPARDRVFVGIREPLGSDNSSLSLNHVIRAREMLAALLKRYDRVAQDQELAETLEETVEMYEVYVEKAHRLMREARQGRNPLSRRMAVIEVDQAYLDRFAEVLTMRREIVAEFGRMLSDDPRLLSRFLDRIRRRQNSLRDQLSELAERQDEVAMELSGWQQVDPAQRGDLWMIVAELRTHSATPLAKDAAELQERIERSMPLQLKKDEGTAARIIDCTDRIARLARQITFDVETYVAGPDADDRPDLMAGAELLVDHFDELSGLLDQLDFEQEDEEITEYVTGRLLESRAVADQADQWSRIAGHLEQKRFHGLVEVDQDKLAIATELLRIDMLEIENDLQGQFQNDLDSDLPGEIIDMIRQLHRVMEALTMNQQAATFALSQARLEEAEEQQALALDRFDQAEELFDRIRRAVVSALDEFDPPDPNIADLNDPTLDEFLAQLEREPNIAAQLGIPNRPRNLRVITDLVALQQAAGGMLGESEEAARARARKAREREEELNQTTTPDERELSEEERQQLARAEDMKEMLEKSLQQIQQKANDPATSAEERKRLQQMARNLERMLEQMDQPNADAAEWEKIAESDRAREVLEALARGEAIPDEQWNRLLSTLDDGLWQVRRRTPPEDYRKAIEQYQERIRQLTDSL